MRYLLLVFMIFSLKTYAQETRPTTVTPRTPEQIEAHKEVAKKQKVLKKKLINKAPPEEIHKAKGEVQETRVKANKADVMSEVTSEE